MENLNTLILRIFLLSSLLLFKVSYSHSNEAVEVTQIEFTGADGFKLVSDYYKFSDQSPSVFILHDCSRVSAVYSDLAKSIASQGWNVLQLDMRGYGRSISDEFSHKDIKSDVSDILHYQAVLDKLKVNWSEDVLKVYKEFWGKQSLPQPISLISFGCNVATAIDLASKVSLKSHVIITPKLTREYREAYKQLEDIPSFYVASVHHTQSYLLSKELFDWNGDNRSRLLILKENSAGTGLLENKRELQEEIKLWLIGNQN